MCHILPYFWCLVWYNHRKQINYGRKTFSGHHETTAFGETKFFFFFLFAVLTVVLIDTIQSCKYYLHMLLAPGELKTVKKSLIETKPPVENDVKESLEYLLSHLNLKEENDKERVLFNDTLSICLLRYNHFSNTFEHSNKVFDYILTHVNRNYAPLQNSLNSIFEKLVMFQNADLPLWIDMLMQQSLTKNLFVLLERLLRRVPDRLFFISKYPDYLLQAMSMFTDNVANAISKTLIAIYEDSYLMYEKNTETWYKSWIRIINLQNDGVRANAITHLLPGLLRVDPQTFELLLADCKSNLKALVSILSMGLK